MDKNIAIAQLNTIAGDIEYNLELALKTIKKAKENSVDLIIFPELFLIGNPIFDVPKRYPKTIKKNIETLNDFKKECENICAIIGFMDEDFSSSIAFIQNGKIKNVIKKNTERIINFDGKKIQILFDEEFCHFE